MKSQIRKPSSGKASYRAPVRGHAFLVFVRQILGRLRTLRCP
jgi:hypothetical protein